MITYKLNNGELHADIVDRSFVLTTHTNEPFCSLKNIDIQTYRTVRQWLPMYHLIKEVEEKYYGTIRTKQTLKR